MHDIRCISAIVCFVFALFTLQSAFADDYSHVTTRKEQGVFAFFGLAGVAPDYEHWVKSTSEFQNLPQDKQDDFFIKEAIRLGTGYSQYEPGVDMLNIETSVSLSMNISEDQKSGRLYFSFPNQGKEYIPTFSYPYGRNEWVSLVVNKLALFSDMYIEAEHFSSVSKHLRNPDDTYRAILTMRVKPIEADHVQPVTMGRVKQWIMVGEIAYMKCDAESDVTGKMEKMWDYVAPWYQEQYELETMPEDLKYPHPFDIKK